VDNGEGGIFSKNNPYRVIWQLTYNEYRLLVDPRICGFSVCLKERFGSTFKAAILEYDLEMPQSVKLTLSYGIFDDGIANLRGVLTKEGVRKCLYFPPHFQPEIEDELDKPDTYLLGSMPGIDTHFSLITQENKVRLIVPRSISSLPTTAPSAPEGDEPGEIFQIPKIFPDRLN
jgi:hypothetical protein